MARRAISWSPWPPATMVAAAWLAAAPACLAADQAASIEQLGSPQFARREAAARELAKAGEPVVEKLEQAATGSDLEVASRSIDILGQLLDADDGTVAAAATVALERLADGGEPAARLAASALEFQRLGRSTAARARLEALGAVVRERPVDEGRGLDVEIASEWRGESDDLGELARLRRVVAVGIHGVPIDSGGMAVLGRLDGVQRIELFGTGVADADVARLAERQPTARIDVRRGGRLGVSSASIAGRCEIRTVEPGSAADQAGLRSGDVILSLDAVAVTSFDELTVKLGDRAPGEVLRLVVDRRGGSADGDPERIECDVRLDAW